MSGERCSVDRAFCPRGRGCAWSGATREPRPASRSVCAVRARNGLRLCDVETFEAATAQLAENQKRKRARVRGPRWLLQGLTVCRRCRYAYYAKTSRLSPTDASKGSRHYYRCIGADAHRFTGATKCGNPTVRGDRLD